MFGQLVQTLNPFTIFICLKILFQTYGKQDDLFSCVTVKMKYWIFVIVSKRHQNEPCTGHQFNTWGVV